MFALKFTALVSFAAILLTLILAMAVGRERGRSGLKAPQTSGNEDFERAFRIHYNTIEQLVLFIPLLWMATSVIGDIWSAAIGIFWLVGRVLYASAYRRDPQKRGPGMIVTLMSTAVLALVVLWGLIMSFV